MSLEQFFLNSGNRTDKYNLGYISEFYDKLFSPVQNDVKKILEIGISEGESIKLWHDFFQNAVVYGIDVTRCEIIENYERIKPIYQNAYSNELVDQLEKNAFDIVIDDGPHTFESMTFFLTNYIDLLKPNGIMVLEDIIDRNWTPKLLEIIKHRTDIDITVYDMRQKQKISFLYEKWRNGLDVIVVKKHN